MTAGDKRLQKRVKISIPVDIVDLLNNRRCVGRITDISAGGVSFLTNAAIEAETPLSIAFSFEGCDFKNIAADVVRCIKKEAHYYIAAAFFDMDPLIAETLDLRVRHVFSRTERGMQRGKLI